MYIRHPAIYFTLKYVWPINISLSLPSSHYSCEMFAYGCYFPSNSLSLSLSFFFVSYNIVCAICIVPCSISSEKRTSKQMYDFLVLKLTRNKSHQLMFIARCNSMMLYWLAISQIWACNLREGLFKPIDIGEGMKSLSFGSWLWICKDQISLTTLIIAEKNQQVNSLLLFYVGL